MKLAIVREPSIFYEHCVSSHPDKDQVDFDKVVAAHAAYVHELREIGLDIITIPSSNHHPDCMFVEDTAVIEGDKAIISRMGEESRRGEEQATIEVLPKSVRKKTIASPGTIEGGDVIHAKNELIIGNSSRTNLNAIKQTEEYLGVPVKVVDARDIIHLKSYATYLGNDWMLITSRFIDDPAFADYEKLEVPAEEAYAANSLTLGGITLLPKGYEKTKFLIEQIGNEVRTLNTRQFMLCEGALSCLSIII